ncbi:MAG: B12-binding domain-containing protein, partial [Spirochaetota bacterium]
MTDFEALANNVITGAIEQVAELTRKAVAEGAGPMDIINQGLMTGMNVVGQRFKAGEMYIPEVLMSAKAMTAGMEIVKPLITGGEIPSHG